MRTRLSNAMIPISDLRRLTSSSRSTSPEISYSEGKHKVPYTQQGKERSYQWFYHIRPGRILCSLTTLQPHPNSILSGVFSLIVKEKLSMLVVVAAFI